MKINSPVRSRWLDWQPQKFEEVAQSEPTKPTEPGLDGFVGSTSGDSQKICPESAEFVLEGNAVELWSDALGQRFWLVATEEDAARLGEPRGSVYTALEVSCLVRVGDPKIVAEIHHWKKQFDGIVNGYIPERIAPPKSYLRNTPEKQDERSLVRNPDNAHNELPVAGQGIRQEPIFRRRNSASATLAGTYKGLPKPVLPGPGT